MNKILIVDDEPANCELLEVFLDERFEGQFEVQVAGNGQEAIQIVEKSQLQLVLLNIEMPVIDGLQVLKLLQTSNEINARPKSSLQEGRDFLK